MSAMKPQMLGITSSSLLIERVSEYLSCKKVFSTPGGKNKSHRTLEFISGSLGLFEPSAVSKHMVGSL